MGQIRISIALIALLGAAGCANIGKEVEKRSDAPEWFKTRVKEVERKGYPKFSETNMTPRPRKTDAEWAEVKTDLAAAKAIVDTDPRAIDPGPVRDTKTWQASEKQKVETAGADR